MALKITVDDINDVDETFRSLYTEKDGTFILDVEGVDNHPDVANLRNAYNAEKTKRQEQGDKLRDALAKLEAKPNPTAKDDAEMIRLREALEAERDQWKAKATDLEKTVYGLTVESQLDTALRSAGITDATFHKAAKRLLQDGVKVVDGKPVFETDMGPVALADHVKRWASSEGAVFVAPPAGGGAGGGGSKGSVKLTKDQFVQMGDKERIELFKSDPDVFRSLSAVK